MEVRYSTTDIYDMLYRLGVTANYVGFFHTAYAVSLCIDQPDRLLLVTKWLYPEIAKQYNTNWKAVERNIRMVNAIIWRENRPLLEEMAHRTLEHKPHTPRRCWRSCPRTCRSKGWKKRRLPERPRWTHGRAGGEAEGSPPASGPPGGSACYWMDSDRLSKISSTSSLVRCAPYRPTPV